MAFACSSKTTSINICLKVLLIVAITILCSLQKIEGVTSEDSGNITKDATVFIAILARNKAHTLPYFLTLLEQFDYPKNRISLWIRSDHNEDNTMEILKKWLASVDGQYHSIDSELLSSPPNTHEGQMGPTHWSTARFTHVIQLKEEALDTARNMWVDYILFLDCDAFITNADTLRLLISKDQTVVAPMLRSDGLYSNFWCGMSDTYYYLRTDEYTPIVYWKTVGCFKVPMVHSVVLIDLRKKVSNNLTFVSSKVENYSGPHDDIIIFAASANKSDIPLMVCNDNKYGYIMVPLTDTDPISNDLLQLTNVKMQVLAFEPPLPVSDLLSEYTSFPTKDKMGFDQVYMINLLRRPDRRERMYDCFNELGIEATAMDAVDGGLLDESALTEWGITVMPDYKDPHHKRPMTLGEIGCFLSHYNIWLETVQKGYSEVMVLEDDIQFEPFFRYRMNLTMTEIKTRNIEWDIIYLGRKRLEEQSEPFHPSTELLVKVGYSYWTLGYLLSQRGARKLLAAQPLEKLLPVDEFLPIMFDKHPTDSWKAHYPTRDLVALSAHPLLLFPTHYIGEHGYVSDTEDSVIIDPTSSPPSQPSQGSNVPREDL